MADDTTGDHTNSDHQYASMLVGLTCGTLVAGTGFTIHARAVDALQGAFAVHYVWAD